MPDKEPAAGNTSGKITSDVPNNSKSNDCTLELKALMGHNFQVSVVLSYFWVAYYMVTFIEPTYSPFTKSQQVFLFFFIIISPVLDDHFV